MRRALVFILTLSLSSCNNALLITPQIPVGGLNSGVSEEYPSYSSDGRYLAFASDRNGRRSIYLYDLQQRQLVSLPNLNRRDSMQDQPDLSLDGRYIAYVSTERGKTDIMIYDRLSQRSELLTANVRGSVRHPTISGDGKKVAFQTSQGGQWNIAIVERK
ncbi:biopolymer transporter [Aphanothece hegewaldii CCALA 016]|uniref:Biopolymer transporter n=1 Tax=Aphanothece hegewaldii CCALA 016 TaxID=2107694 RepID=A0A2T1LWJ1_9CHRO|nr:TolB family protein [Aphanothece hegewaldii]PSF36193.1 biopolymer transporter [Aphanothece hegewaldii CCALA 016]